MSNVKEVAKGRSTDMERGQRRKLEANERFVSRKEKNRRIVVKNVLRAENKI